MPNTVNNAIPFVPENTIDPAAGLNLSLNTVDALLQVLVQTVGANSAPGSPPNGSRYIVGTIPTGAWSGQANRLARYVDSGWQFFDANYSLNAADGLWYVRSATTWAALEGGGGGGGGEANTASNIGGGQGLYTAKVGVDLRIKSLIAGTNVTLSSDSDTLTINATPAEDLATVATTGAYADLSGLPSLGTAAATAATDYATAEQGDLADTALQPAAIGTTAQAYDANTAKLDAPQAWTAAQRFGQGTSAASAAMGDGSALDLAAANAFTKTIIGTTTLSLTNVPGSGMLTMWVLELTNGGSAAVTWWPGIAWVEGAPPILSPADRDLIGFYTINGGTGTIGFVIGQGV